MLRFLTLSVLLLSALALPAQIMLKVGDEAPLVSPTEYLVNPLKRSDLREGFRVVTLCKTWDLPCFNDLPLLDSLRMALPDETLTFLTLFRGRATSASGDLGGTDFGVSVATDLSGDTQLRYGDGKSGMVSWPLTVLIDEQNIVRWQGDVDDLTPDALRRFVAGKQPIVDLTKKYVPLDYGDYAFEPMTLREASLLHAGDSVNSFFRVWISDPGIDQSGRSLFSQSYAFGYFEDATLEEIYRRLFPRIRVSATGILSEQRYTVSFVDREVDREAPQRIREALNEDLGLTATVSQEPTTYYTLDVVNEEKLNRPRPTTQEPELPGARRPISSVQDRDLHAFAVNKHTLAELAELLNQYSSNRWLYEGRSRKRYNFMLDASSTKALVKSLRQYGLSVKGRAGTVEEVTLTIE